MGKTIAELMAKIKIDDAGVNSRVDGLKNKLSGLNSEATRAEGAFGGLGSKIFGSLGGAVGIITGLGVALAGLAVQSVKVAGDFEQMAVSLEVLTGSKAAGDELLNSIVQLANVTPMTSAGLLDNTKLLLAFGEAQKNIIPDLKMLGDVAGGNQEKMNSLALAFAQAGAAGRLQGQDLLQMVNAGFNPLQQISERTGKSMGQLRAEMEKGQIPFSMLRQAFIDATSEGGRFYGMMEKQSQTLSGRLSTLADTWTLVGNSIGKMFLPAAKSAVNALIVIGNYAQKTINALLNMEQTFIRIRSSFTGKGVPILREDPKVIEQLKKQGLYKTTTSKISTPKIIDESLGFADTIKEDAKKKAKGKSAEKLADEKLTKDMKRLDTEASIRQAKMKLIASQEEEAQKQLNINILKDQLKTEEAKLVLTKFGTDKYKEQLAVKLNAETAYNKAVYDQKMEVENKIRDVLKRGLNDTINAYLHGTGNIKDVFRNMLLEIEKDILVSKIPSLIGRLLNVPKTQTGSSAILTGLKSIGSWFGGFFAEGGRPDPNSVSVVGEKGAELFVPDGVSGTVIPNNKLGALGQGSSQGQTVNPVINNININVQSLNGKDAYNALNTPEAKASIRKTINEGLRLNQDRLRDNFKTI